MTKVDIDESLAVDTVLKNVTKENNPSLKTCGVEAEPNGVIILENESSIEPEIIELSDK